MEAEGEVDTLSEAHPRYTIMIRGCSSRVYAIVDPEEEVHYKKLLGKDMLSEHVWRTKENPDAIRQLVSLWAVGRPVWDG